MKLGLKRVISISLIVSLIFASRAMITFAEESEFFQEVLETSVDASIENLENLDLESAEVIEAIESEVVESECVETEYIEAESTEAESTESESAETLEMSIEENSEVLEARLEDNSEAFEKAIVDSIASPSLFHKPAFEIATMSLFGTGEHSHKACGVTGTCLHHVNFPGTSDTIPGATEHFDNLDYVELTDANDLNDTSKSQYLYLTADVNFSGIPAPSREVYLCLNGHDITITFAIPENLHITNCSNNVATINTISNIANGNMSIYGFHNNIDINSSNAIVNVQYESNIYLYGVSLKGSLGENYAFLTLDNYEKNITLERVNIGNTLTGYRSMFECDSQNTTLNFIDIDIDSAPATSSYGFFYASWLMDVNFYGDNTFSNMNLGSTGFVYKNGNYHKLNINVKNGTTRFDNITTTGYLILTSGHFNVSSGAKFTIANCTCSMNSGIFYVENNELLVEEGGTLEIINNTMHVTSGYYGINIPSNNSILGNFIVTGNSSDGGVIAETMYIASTLNIGNGKIYIAENTRDGIYNFNEVLFVHYGGTNSNPVISVAAGKTINPNSLIQGLYGGNVVINDWSLVRGTADYTKVFSYCPYYSYILNYDTSDDAIKIVSGNSYYTVTFKDSDGNDITELANRKVQNGFDIGNPKPDGMIEGQIVTWYKTRDNVTGALSNPWSSSDRVTGNITLYGDITTATSYTLRYNSNGGAGTMSDRTGLYQGTTYTLDNVDFTRDGYEFLHWAENADGSGETWIDGDTSFTYYGTDDPKIIYAIWAQIHSHKICGVTGNCIHSTNIVAGTDAHTNQIYSPLNSVNDLYDASKSEYLYLTSDINISSPLTRDIYLCLNGYSVTGTENTQNYKIYITNCSSTVSTVGDFTNKLCFKNPVEYYGINKNIILKGQNLFYYETTGQTSGYYYDIDFSFKIQGNAENPFYVYGGTLTLENIVFDGENQDDNYNTYTPTSIFYSPGELNLINTTIKNYKSRMYVFYSPTAVNFYDNNLVDNLTSTTNGYKRLISGSPTIKITSGETIISNLVEDSFMENVGAMEINNVATLSIINNTFKASGTSGAEGIFTITSATNKLYGNLNIINNKYVSCVNNLTYYRYGAVLITSAPGASSGSPAGRFNIGSGVIKIYGNKAYTGDGVNPDPSTEYHMYQIYSRATDNATPIFVQSTGTTFNTNTYIAGIAFPERTNAGSNGFGHIINSNTHKECFVADAYNDASPTSPKNIATKVEGGNLVVGEPVYSYNLIYNANGGSGTMDTESGLDANTTHTLVTNAFTKSNYKFIGWCADQSKANPTEWTTVEHYIDSDTTFSHTITDPADDGEDVTLYAVWQLMTYTLHYDMNSGTGTIADMTNNESGATITLSAIKPTKTHYRFIGWATSSTATAASYSPGGNFSLILNPSEFDPASAEPIKNIYAVWQKITYTVTYNKNGGTGTDMSVSNGESGVDLTLSNNTYTRTDYKFLGWDENSSATDPTYSTTAGMVMNKTLSETDSTSITVYAIWQKYTYTLHYDMNGGGDIITPPSIDDIINAGSGDNVTLSNIIPVRENYTFLGWADTSTATTAQYSKGGTYKTTVDSDSQTKTIYAVWAYQYPYTIRFNANGGEGTMDDIVATSSISRSLPDNIFTKTNYSFLGWNENQSATSASIADKGSITKIFDSAGQIVILYAIWKDETPAPKPQPVPPSGGGGSPSGGGGGGGVAVDGSGPIAVQTTNIPQVKKIVKTIDMDNANWIYDPLANAWKLAATTNKGTREPLTSGFYVVKSITNIQIGDVNVPMPTSNTYYFDDKGNMVTGWVNTVDLNTYFFDNSYGASAGQMVTGWKQINGSWYYFGDTGALARATLTPDGYVVDMDGKLAGITAEDNLNNGSVIKAPVKQIGRKLDR